MSGIVNKIKDALHSDKSSQPEGTSGPHSSRAANAADPRVDSDRDGRSGLSHGTAGTHGTTGVAGTHGTHGTTGVTGTHGASGLTGTHGSTTAGPHSSNLANKADPRVDSDRDGRGIGQGPAGTTATGTHNTHNTHNTHGTTGLHSSGATGLTGTHGTSGLTGTHGTSGLTGTHGNTGYGSTTAGPHSSDLANKVDPRVDSDRDGRGIGQGPAGTSATGTHGSHNTHGTSGLTGTHGNTGYGSTAAGPHSSNIANKADPRVDSDRDGRGIGQGHAGTTATGTHGTHSTVHGTHATTGPNATGAHTSHGGVGGVAGSGPGPAPNTAGPHKSDMLNKVDPRVDSDLDGSKTVGGNKTYQAGTTTTGYNKDPTDAAQVPPSVLQKTLGSPVVAHDDHGHDRERRNSTATHQETHRGV